MKKIRNRNRIIILSKKRFQRKLKRKLLKKLLKKHPEFIKNRKIQRLERKRKKKQFINIIPPSNFSIINNSNETLSYFKKVEKSLSNYEPVYIDMKNIKDMTVDALIYHIALSQRIKLLKYDYYLEGSFPENNNIKNLMINSGYLHYVLTQNRKIKTDDNCIKIKTGQKANNDIIKRTCEFVQKKLGVTRIETKHLYNIIFEMMLNTKHHAYNTDNQDYSHWMLFTRFRPNKEVIEFVFVDTGHGIPSTVRKNKIELVNKWFSKLQITEFNESDLVKSALDGAYRTRTGKGYRGRGLPEIYKHYKTGYINDLNIITNNACLKFNDCFEGSDLEAQFKGTLFFWKVTKEGIYEKNKDM